MSNATLNILVLICIVYFTIDYIQVKTTISNYERGINLNDEANAGFNYDNDDEYKDNLTKPVYSKYLIACGCLGIARNYTKEELKAAYRKAAKIYHPDNKDTGNAVKFREINTAFNYLQGQR